MPTTLVANLTRMRIGEVMTGTFYDCETIIDEKTRFDAYGIDIFEEAIFIGSGENLKYVDLESADLSDMDLSEANLSYANLKGANLSGSILFQVNLESANLEGADLTDADLEGANMKDVNLYNAIFCNTFMLDGSSRNDDC